MNFFSNTQETARRFGDYIEDLHDIFRCNRVDFGSPQDFIAFARTVKHQSELRDDVMRVVQSLREDETNISFRTILTIIAVASGGPDVALSDLEMSVPVQVVVESFDSVGRGSQHNTELGDPPDSSGSNLAATEPNGIVAPQRTTSGEEVAGYRGVSYDLPVSGTDLDYSNTLAESLTRLELNSLQLKTYIDSIEQRITRIEPHVESTPSPILPVVPLRPLDKSEAGYFATVLSEDEPEHQLNDLPVSNQGRVATEPKRIFAGLWGNAQPFSPFRSKGALPIFVGATTLVLSASLLWMLERGSGSVVRHSTDALANGDGRNLLSGVSLGVHDPLVSMMDALQADTGQGKSGSGVSNSEDLGTHAVKRKPAKSPFKSPLRASLSHPVNAQIQSVASSETSENAPSDGADGLGSEPLEHRPFDVSSDVMAANLVSAPKPSYPKLASLTHMQGSVVMQAVISRNGTVERLHVIKGHHLLRSAAKNAVQTWRYRPYKVDGVPVEVATVVSVDFSRHR